MKSLAYSATLFMLCIGAVVNADSTNTQPPTAPLDTPEPYRVWIQSRTTDLASTDDTLLVMIDAKGREIAGFDFKIGCDANEIEITAVLPGEVPDSCNWELFDARTANNAAREGYPLQLWSTVALAQTVPKPEGPVCFGFDRPAALARIVLSRMSLGLGSEDEARLYFFWEDCGDNTLASVSGGELYVSTAVFEPEVDSTLAPGDVLPSRTGAPAQCVDASAQRPPERLIEFTNGAIRYEFERWRDLRVELEQMLEADQALRFRIDTLQDQYGWDSDTFQKTWDLQHQLDEENLSRLEEIVEEYGWPNPAEVGEMAALAAVLIIQHAELEVQLKYVDRMRAEMESGRLDPSSFALLEDRIRMRQGKPQVYGSQLTVDGATGKLMLHPIEDSANVDQRRAAVGLEPLADYLKRCGVEVPGSDAATE